MPFIVLVTFVPSVCTKQAVNCVPLAHGFGPELFCEITMSPRVEPRKS